MIFFGEFRSNGASMGVLGPLLNINVKGTICIKITNESCLCTAQYTGTYLNGRVVSFVPSITRLEQQNMMLITGNIGGQTLSYILPILNLDTIPINSKVVGTYTSQNPSDSGIVEAIRFE